MHPVLGHGRDDLGYLDHLPGREPGGRPLIKRFAAALTPFGSVINDLIGRRRHHRPRPRSAPLLALPPLRALGLTAPLAFLGLALPLGCRVPR
jgi:hypothetical protein